MTKEPKGIGGWLLVPAFDLIMSIFLILFLLILSIMLMFDTGDLFSIIMFLVFSGVTLLTFYVAFLFFKKKKSLPKYYKLFMVIRMVLTVFLFIVGDLQIGQSVASILGGGIWLIYFTNSVRIKNTFVN